MYLLVDVCGYHAVQIGLRHVGIQRAEVIVYAGCTMIVDVPLVAHDARLHAHDVVLRSFLPVRIIALQLELGCFEVVAGVVFVRDGQRNQMQLLQSVNDVALSTHGHHLQDALCRAVI